MAVALSGMSLHTDSDNEVGFDGTTAGPDTYNVAVQGANSESWNVAKNSTEVSTLTKSSALNATRGLVIFWMKSDVSYYYVDISVALRSSVGNQKLFTIATAANPEISGDFHGAAMDYVNKGAPTGTFVPASFSSLVTTVNNSTSGNIRSVINNWIDAIYYGPGHTISGSTVGVKLFTESAAVDQLVANQYGILENKDGVIFSQGDISLTGATLTSSGETLVFRDTTNGYDRYNFDISGTVVFTNTAITGSGVIDFDMDLTGATFTMNGGSITQCNQLTTVSGQTLDGVVLTDVNLSTIANATNNSVWNLSGPITLTNTLSGCTVNEAVVTASTAAVIVDDLAKVADTTFIRGANGYTTELTSIGGGSMTWSASTTGYRTGTAGSPITATNLGDEDIYVNVGSGELTINVASGATTPSIRSAGAIVNIVSGATLTINNLVANTEIRVHRTSDGAALGGIELATTADPDNAGKFKYDYAYSTNEAIYIQVINIQYEILKVDYTLDGTDQKLQIAQRFDRNYSNPA